MFRRRGRYEFDVGLHYLGDCQPGGVIPTVLRGLGLAGRIEFVPMDRERHDTMRFPDFTFRMPVGWDAYLARLVELFPDERRPLTRCVHLPDDTAFRSAVGRAAQRGGYQRDPGYLRLKQTLTERAVRAVTSACPGLDGHIVWQETSTPLPHERYTLSTSGSWAGLAISPGQLAATAGAVLGHNLWTERSEPTGSVSTR